MVRRGVSLLVGLKKRCSQVDHVVSSHPVNNLNERRGLRYGLDYLLDYRKTAKIAHSWAIIVSTYLAVS